MVDEFKFGSAESSVVRVDGAKQMQRLVNMIGDGEIRADRFEIQVVDRTLVIESKDGQLVGTIVQEHTRNP